MASKKNKSFADQANKNAAINRVTGDCTTSEKTNNGYIKTADAIPPIIIVPM